MIIPTTLFYTKNHEWIGINPEEVKVGITEYGQELLGDIIEVSVNTVGKFLKQQDVFGTLKASEKIFNLHLPVSGTILEVNPKLSINPVFINESPYFKGWIIKVKIREPKEYNSLLIHWKYRRLIGEDS